MRGRADEVTSGRLVSLASAPTGDPHDYAMNDDAIDLGCGQHGGAGLLLSGLQRLRRAPANVNGGWVGRRGAIRSACSASASEAIVERQKKFLDYGERIDRMRHLIARGRYKDAKEVSVENAKIGKAVARRAHGFSMRVLYWTPHRKPESEEQAAGLTHVPLDELLAGIAQLAGSVGIGQLLNVARGRFDYDRVSLIVVEIFVFVFVVEFISLALRRRLVR